MGQANNEFSPIFRIILCRYRELSTIQRHVKVPDSITDWSIYGMAQCCATGFCVSEPVSLKVSKPVFVECHLPYSLKRLQQVTLVCSAYNYNDHEQTVRQFSSYCK